MNAFSQTTTSLPLCLRTSLVTVLNKTGSPRKVESDRPIALVNVFAKIVSSVYSIRIKPLLKHFIPNIHARFVPGRTITEKLILMQGFLHWSKRHCLNSKLLSLDFTKAYDRAQRPFLQQVLRKTRFGSGFQNLVAKWYYQR